MSLTPIPACPEIAERISRFVQVASTGCWEWRGATIRNGYGTMKVSGRMVAAHRASYEAHVGPIPSGLVIDHLCRNHACVNPKHLEPVTHQVNILRGCAATKTICKHGHPLSGENLTIVHRSDGSQFRRCVTCQRAGMARFYASRGGAR